LDAACRSGGLAFITDRGENVTSMNLRAESRQAQKLSPRLQHAVRLLQMSSLDFSATVRDLLGRNPFLEAEEGEDGENVEALATEASADGDAAADEVAVSEAVEGSAGESHDDDRDLWQADGASSLRGADDGELSALEKMAADTSLATHLHGQANLLGLSERALFMARAIIESLDDDGYLRTALEELVGLVPVTPSATLEEMERALTAVQSLEPAGVGARSVAECLLLQLPDIPCPNVRALARRIVEEQLPKLAARDVQGLAHALGEPVAMVEQVCDRIRRLDPRPGWRHGSSRVAYVVPDVIVRKVHNKWTVHLNPAVVPKVRLNHVYAELFKRHRSAGNSDMAGQLQEARWTLRNVEQRFSTILDVAEAIVRRQHHFFEFGAMAMKPLGSRKSPRRWASTNPPYRRRGAQPARRASADLAAAARHRAARPAACPTAAAWTCSPTRSCDANSEVVLITGHASWRPRSRRCAWARPTTWSSPSTCASCRACCRVHEARRAEGRGRGPAGHRVRSSGHFGHLWGRSPPMQRSTSRSRAWRAPRSRCSSPARAAPARKWWRRPCTT
jgi:RNA polymerase sigma-54 factor